MTRPFLGRLVSDLLHKSLLLLLGVGIVVMVVGIVILVVMATVPLQ